MFYEHFWNIFTNNWIDNPLDRHNLVAYNVKLAVAKLRVAMREPNVPER